MDIQRSMGASVRYQRAVYCAAGNARCAVARKFIVRAGRVPWNSGDDCASLRVRRRADSGQNGAGDGRRRGGRALRDPACKMGRRNRCCDSELGCEGGARAQRRRRCGDQLSKRERRRARTRRSRWCGPHRGCRLRQEPACFGGYSETVWRDYLLRLDERAGAAVSL